MYTEKILGFFAASQNDFRINAIHIALYLALFQLWYKNNGRDPVSFSKQELMKAAKINGRATYHRCIRELHEYGYISYVPSHHPVLGSIAFLDKTGSPDSVTYLPEKK
ncbi:MAG: hypothetical protein BGO55_08865 [Sphingobacteriales bacterium 50-39]|nr:hypothetical protein [Sphingobacteriales bacterium]OJW59373.1 MAG: hypothetical protein BGO55_08865 [Sphingobacteriales bacterium 50-39]